MTNDIATNGPDHGKAGFILTSAVYDRLRYGVNYVLPAAAALYAGLALLFHFGYGTEVVGATGLVVIFLNVVLGKSKANYNAEIERKNPSEILGVMHVNTTDPEEAVVGLEMPDVDPNYLAGKNTVTLAVNSITNSQ